MVAFKSCFLLLVDDVHGLCPEPRATHGSFDGNNNNFSVIDFIQLIQFMPLIQFNVYYTLHSNNNNNRPSNNLLVIDYMLLIQFMLLIIGGFCDRDLHRQAAATAEWLRTEALRAEDHSPQRPGSRPQGPTSSGGATLNKLVRQNKLSRRRAE